MFDTLLTEIDNHTSLIPHTNGTTQLVLTGSPDHIATLIKEVKEKYQYQRLNACTVLLSIATDYMTHKAYTALDYFKVGLQLISSGYSHTSPISN